MNVKFEDYVPHKELLKLLKYDGVEYLSKNLSYEKVEPESMECFKLIEHVPAKCIYEVTRNISAIYKKVEKVDGRVTYDAVLQSAAKLGYLSFEPYVAEGNKYPVLVLGYNKFLSLYRGLGFMVAYDFEGEEISSTSGICLAGLLKPFRDEQLLVGDYVQMMYYANAIKAAWEFDVFRKFVQGDTYTFDMFMERSMLADGVGCVDMMYKKMCSVIINPPIEIGSIGRPHTAVRVPMNDNIDICRMYLYEENIVAIQVPTAVGINRIFFETPKVTWDNSVKEAFERKYPNKEEMLSKFAPVALACQSRVYEHLFLGFMLAVAGFTTTRRIRSIDRPCRTLARVDDYEYITIERLSKFDYAHLTKLDVTPKAKGIMGGYAEESSELL